MLNPTIGILITLGALALFAWIGVRAASAFGVGERDAYLTARRSQGSTPLALSLFASALGAWILFAPPEVGTFAGLLGIAGYAVGQALAVAAFAVLGPRVRKWLPEGTTILEFVRHRFGRVLQAYVGIVAVAYMFVFLTAELTAVGGVLASLAGTGAVTPVVAVAVATAAYTAYGGLPASLATDRWQAWLVMALVVGGILSVTGTLTDPFGAAQAGGLWRVSATGAEVGITLVIAVVAANLFHQGFWQRVWSARDDRALTRGALGAGALIIPLVFVTGSTGAIAAGRGALGDPSIAFFELLADLPGIVLAGVVLLAVALVASTTDTLQNGLTSLVSVHVAGGRVRLSAARAVTIALTVPAAAIAVQQVSVLRLFLIADLFAATVVVPVFCGLWRRATTPAALAGAVAGVLGVVGAGSIAHESLEAGVRLLTLPEGPSLVAFAAAPLASAAVTVAWTMLLPRPRTRRTAAPQR